MATATQDDGFHEIQLNGKQLVFLFMAVTVVLVVTFLCGVLVGRGVQLDRGGPTPGGTLAAGSEVDAPPPPASANVQGTSSAPAAGNEDLKYPEMLGNDPPPAEKLRAASEPPAPPAKAEPVAPEPPAQAPAPASSAARDAVPAAPGEPRGPGLAIQVAAVKEKADADQIANRLIGKGYKAFVVAPAAGTPAVYRVRVGKFKEQRDADSVAARLKKEEQFDPWIVR
jgi:cell division septation protein DedD